MNELKVTNRPETRDSAGRSRLKVLVCAYACSPARGSEFGVGWGWVQALSNYHDLWVITGAHCRDEIEAELLRRPELRSRISFHYVARTRYPWAEKLWPPAYLFTYRHQWQKAAFAMAKQLHDRVHFDVAHQLTYVGFRVPGLLWKLDTPFVWGPIGGLEQTTWALLPALGVRGALYFVARNLLNAWDKSFSRIARRAFAKADGGIIAATTGIQKEIGRVYGRSSIIISEIGLPPVTRQAPLQRHPSEPLALIWSGNHLPGKALPFLLSALKTLPADLNWKLTILGDGPCSAKWRKLAMINGIADRCEWLGPVPRSTALEKMQQAHALVITSIYDLTSTVLVEALATGLPVLCPDHCGFADAITAECGIKVPATSSRELISGLRDGIVRLNNELVRFQLAQGAIRRSANYEWDRKALNVSEIYNLKTRAPEAPSMGTAGVRTALAK
jgi:glycosyltransferase involved in cell wall biosynthesis